MQHNYIKVLPIDLYKAPKLFIKIDFYKYDSFN